MPYTASAPPTSPAKAIRVTPIAVADARRAITRWHYSGTFVNNSMLHLGVFLGARLEGVMSFGPSLDKRKLIGLVADTRWNGFIELNRMAFSERLPRNSESRALGVAFRLIRRHYPHLEWVVSFADATQCGDGTIYRAAGFVLTQIKRNDQIWAFADHTVHGMALRPLHAPKRKATFTRMMATDTRRPKARGLLNRVTATKGGHIAEDGAASMRKFIEAGARPLPGFQLRYVYFLNPAARARLTVPIVPFARIAAAGASMYRGQKQACEASDGGPLRTATG